MRIAMLLVVVLLGCSTSLPSKPSQPSAGPLPAARGRILVTPDCSRVPQAPRVGDIESPSPSVIEATDLDQVTISFVVRDEEVLLAIDGMHGDKEASPKTRHLYSGANVEDKYSAVPGEEDGFLSARLWEGGGAYTQFRVRLDRCLIEVLNSERGDDGSETPWLVIQRIAIRPGASIWTR